MAFKSYSWSIGTTSFRTSQLNYKIERQLQLLKEFWKQNISKNWFDSTNNNFYIKLFKKETKPTQVEYYEYLKKNNFLTGEAKIRDKDAREKTSGLVDIGVLTADRRLTEVGEKIEGLLNKEVKKDNIFLISEDSYYYLLQFLKLQVTDGGLKIKPFIALIYMIEKLDYLTYDEFTYLLPLCKNKYDVKEMIKTIKANRLGIDTDTIIITKIYDMPNYLQAWQIFREDYPVTEKTFEKIGLNRKSRTYDRPYNNLYHILVDLVFHLKNENFISRLDKYNALYNACKKISGNTQKLWNDYLFLGYKPKQFNEEFDSKFKKISLSLQKNIIDFKRVFFEKLHVFKWKVNLKEYFDLNKRYFSLTDIIKFEEDKIELDLLAKYYFENIIDDLLEEELLDQIEYMKLFHSLVPIEKISTKYHINMKNLVNNINTSLGTDLTIYNIKNYVESEKLKEFNKLIDSKFKTEDLISLLQQIKNREDESITEYVTDNATVPTIFEYVLAIAWYRISGKKGNILDYMNLSLDADLLPKTHAGGGMADILYKYNESTYPKHDLILEATLSESTGQRKMELESVPRHLATNIIQTDNSFDYAIFVASNLEENVILGMRGVRNTYYPKGNGEYINDLKIIPIDIEILIKILVNNIKYEDIYKWFDRAYRSTISDPIWYQKEILEKI